ncbi:MAG: hypothetical protein ACJ8AS_08385 [Hyphomicrobiales bacterium]
MTARVLVLEDILANVRLLEAKLSAEYFDSVTAIKGADALQWCSAHQARGRNRVIPNAA